MYGQINNLHCSFPPATINETTVGTYTWILVIVTHGIKVMEGMHMNVPVSQILPSV